MSNQQKLEEHKRKADLHYEHTKLFHWQFSQMFGETDDSDESSDSLYDNHVSVLEFNQSGEYLAVGYDIGQVVVLKQINENSFGLYTEFQSHVATYDHFSAMEVEEKISDIKWYPYSGGRNEFMMTTNSKTVKMFKLTGIDEYQVDVREKKLFDSGHTYNIHSVAFNNDGETFISADDLSINLWNIEINDECFEIIDMKPEDINDLSEVITCASTSPIDSNVLIYSTSKGITKLVDLRVSSAKNQASRTFQDLAPNDNFFREITDSIGYSQFSPNGDFLATRDYLNVNIWDTRMESNPLLVLEFNPEIKKRLYELYENSFIFDRFDCSWGGDSFRLLTGSYFDNFYICDVFGNETKKYTATKSGLLNATKGPDYSQKVLITAYHPTKDLVAVASKDYGYFYQLTDKEPQPILAISSESEIDEYSSDYDSYSSSETNV